MRGAYDVVTIYNKWRNPATGKDVWYRHVVPNCSWESKAVRSVSGQAAALAVTISVLITENPLYKPFIDWEAGDKTAFFTIRAGDLIVRGERTTEITGIAPYRESDVKALYAPEVFTVKIFQDNTAAYKRARHYYVEGV